MKQLFTILSACILFSCQKSIDQISPEPITKTGEQEICSFNMTEFNMSKRAPVNYEAAKGRPASSGGKTISPTSIKPNVILLDFNGHLVSNTSWNVNGDINCLPSNLTEAEIGIVFQRVAADYTPFNFGFCQIRWKTVDVSIYIPGSI